MVTLSPSDAGFQRSLEIAVPVVSFGSTLAGILLFQAGAGISFQFFSLGCLVGSCILAYLAWIRPRKDIVALSTPVYGVIFFVVPTDYSAGATLQLLYALSLTALLIRLKNRFGNTASLPASAGEGPLGQYVARVAGLIPDIAPEVADSAGSVFIRFAQGEYESAARLAITCRDGMTCDEKGVVKTAFAIVAEQAGHTAAGTPVPSSFHHFTGEEQGFLFHPVSENDDTEREYTLALDNALLLLYAIGLRPLENDQSQGVSSYGKFAGKLTEG